MANSQLSQFIDSLEQQIQQADSLRDLQACCAATAKYPGTLHYNNSVPLTFGFICAAIAALSAWIGFTNAAFTSHHLVDLITALGLEPFPVRAYAGITAVVVGLVALGIFGFVAARSNSLHRLTTMLCDRAALAHNGLTQDHSPPDMLYGRLSNCFGDFDRGNYSRQITQAFTGQLIIDGVSSVFSFYQLHYVNRRTTRDSKGRPKTVYDHYDRYYLVMPFPSVAGVSLATTSGRSLVRRDAVFHTNHPDFESTVELTADTAMAAARFAKPSVVMALVPLMGSRSGACLEFSHRGQACFSFDDDDLLWYKRPTATLYNAQLLSQEIAAGLPMPHLRQLLMRMGKLSQLTDNNFTNQTAI